MLRSITKYSTCFELLPCHDLIMKSSYKRFPTFRKSVTCRAALHLEKCCSLRIYCSLIWKTIGGETETNCGLMSLFSCECAKVFAACLCAWCSFVLTPSPTDQTITGACSSLHAAQRDSAYKSKWAIEPLNGRWGKRYAGLKFPRFIWVRWLAVFVSVSIDLWKVMKRSSNTFGTPRLWLALHAHECETFLLQACVWQ